MPDPIAQAVSNISNLEEDKNTLRGFFVEFLQDYYLARKREQMLKIASYSILTAGAATATYFGLGNLGIAATTLFGLAACNETYQTFVNPRIMTEASNYLKNNSGENGKFDRQQILGIVTQLGSKETFKLLNEARKDVGTLVYRGEEGINIVPITVEAEIDTDASSQRATGISNISASRLSQQTTQHGIRQ